jgi:Sphingosine kinase and enzymes related to eukaryotic diacylglycerol kinase
MPPIEIIINPASGAGDKNNIEKMLSEFFGPSAHINEAKAGKDLSKLAQQVRSAESETLVACGGDGTVSGVAAAVAGTQNRLGIIPLGTLNHFAKDLMIPLDIKRAAKVIGQGRTRQVDAAEVNGRLFINNSSIGLYPEVVRGRELRERLGHGKWSSFIRSAARVFRRYQMFVVRLNVNGESIVTKTPFVFIGNNEYDIEGLDIGSRKSLDKGQLSVYTTRKTGRLALLRIALRAIFGRLSQEKDFVTFITEEVIIETRRRQIRIAMDGEVSLIDTPLHYRILPLALQVIVPADEPEKEAG